MPAAASMSAPVRWVVAGVCVFVGIIAAWPFWQHVSTLSFHLASGNWEITSDNEAIEKALALAYRADGSAIAIHRVASSGQLLPITEQFRQATVGQVANGSLTEQPSLRFYATPLETTYDQLLRRLEEIAERAPDRLPAGAAELIATAREDYESAKEDRGIDFAPFAVTTTPDFDVEGEWERRSTPMEQNGRCLGRVSELSGAESIAADISTFPRALKVDIERPWLSSPLLDTAAGLPMSTVKQFFAAETAADGSLRLIPESMWVLQTDAFAASVGGEGKARLRKWIQDNACCKVTCQGKTFTVKTVDGWKDDTAHGVLTSPAQQLFAIASRRRGL